MCLLCRCTIDPVLDSLFFAFRVWRDYQPNRLIVFGISGEIAFEAAVQTKMIDDFIVVQEKPLPLTATKFFALPTS